MVAFVVILLLVRYVQPVDLETKPTFTVINSDRISITIPKYDNYNLVIFRVSVRDDRNFEYGENSIDEHVVVYRKNLDLKKGDLINYLIGFKDQFGSYHAQVGTYQFDGKFQHSITRRSLMDSDDAETDFDPLQTRFGGGRSGHHHRRSHSRRGPYPEDLERPGPFPFNPFLNPIQPIMKPGIALLPNQNYYCKCDNSHYEEHTSTTIRTSTDPDIDVRMGQ